MDIRKREKIASTVRFKSYGQFVAKDAGSGDNEEMLVPGFFTDDKMDEVGDIITKEATVKAIKKWRKWGNIRTMHNYPSGRVYSIGEEDGLRWNEIVTIPVDEQTKKMIAGGVLKAYSVGIIPREYEINEEAYDEEEDPWFFPLIIHDYDMIEISYVDHPANYSATINESSMIAEKAFKHRAILFKRMGDMEKDKELETASDELENEEELEKETGTDGVDGLDGLPSDYVDTTEADLVEKEHDDDEDETIEKEAEAEADEEFDVALAVRELSERLDGYDKILDSLVDNVVEKVLDALSESVDESEDLDGASEEPQSDKANEEPVEDEAVITLDKFMELVDGIRKGIVEDVVDALKVDETRTAKLYADDEEEDEPEVSSTQKYLDMDGDTRRKGMMEVLQSAYPTK